MALSPKRAYLAPCLRHSTEIQPYNWTSDTLKMLSEIGIYERVVFDTSL